jgi:Heparinase II/III-like protein
MPDGRLPQFGHTDAAPAPAYARRLGRDDRGLYPLLESGLAVVKEPGAYLSVLASFHSTAHKQADELSFDLYDRGLRIASDTGLYHKDRDRYFEFASSPAAHSTLTVDGQGFGLDEDSAYGSGLIATGEGDGWYAILGRNPLLREQGVAHTRLFLYRPGEALIVADRLRSDEKHTYRRHFQLGPSVGVRPLTVAHVPRAYPTLLLRAPGFEGSLDSGGEAELSRGERDPLRGYVFPGFREKVPRWTATFETRADDANYVAAFDLYGTTLRARVLSFEPDHIRLRMARIQLTVTRSGERLVVESNRS